MQRINELEEIINQQVAEFEVMDATFKTVRDSLKKLSTETLSREWKEIVDSCLEEIREFVIENEDSIETDPKTTSDHFFAIMKRKDSVKCEIEKMQTEKVRLEMEILQLNKDRENIGNEIQKLKNDLVEKNNEIQKAKCQFDEDTKVYTDMAQQFKETETRVLDLKVQCDKRREKTEQRNLKTKKERQVSLGWISAKKQHFKLDSYFSQWIISINDTRTSVNNLFFIVDLKLILCDKLRIEETTLALQTRERIYCQWSRFHNLLYLNLDKKRAKLDGLGERRKHLRAGMLFYNFAARKLQQHVCMKIGVLRKRQCRARDNLSWIQTQANNITRQSPTPAWKTNTFKERLRPKPLASCVILPPRLSNGASTFPLKNTHCDNFVDMCHFRTHRKLSTRKQYSIELECEFIKIETSLSQLLSIILNINQNITTSLQLAQMNVS